jgi:hypothetical protein
VNWNLVFKNYAKGKEKKIALTRYKLINIDDVKFFLKQFFEEQKECLIEEEKEKRGWGFEIVLEDTYGRELPIKNLYELMENGEEIIYQPGMILSPLSRAKKKMNDNARRLFFVQLVIIVINIIINALIISLVLSFFGMGYNPIIKWDRMVLLSKHRSNSNSKKINTPD